MYHGAVSKVLPRDEVATLIRRWQRKGDVAARNAIVEANLGLVHMVVRKVVPSFCRERVEYTYEDLAQEGMLGLLRACDTFDPRRGFTFSTYAWNWVRHMVCRLIQDTTGPVRIPVGRGEKRRVLGLYPFARGKSLDGPVSHHQGINKHQDLTFADLIPADVIPPGDELERERVRRSVREVVATLDEREREVIEKRYLDGEEPTLEEVGETMQRTGQRKRGTLTRERVRQIEVKALSNLRKRLA